MEGRVVSIRLTAQQVEHWAPMVEKLGSWSDLLAWALKEFDTFVEPADHLPESRIKSAEYYKNTHLSLLTVGYGPEPYPPPAENK